MDTASKTGPISTRTVTVRKTRSVAPAGPYEKHITGRGRPGGRCPKCGDPAGTSGYCFDCGG